MSTNITSDNGVEVEVCGLGIAVVNHEEETETWARLSDAQRVELAAALDPGRRGLHVRLDNQAKTLATFQRERDEALRKKGEMVDRAVRAERERDAAVARAEQAEARIEGWREAHDALMENPCPVTLDEVEKAIERWKLTGQSRGATLADDLHALLSGDDPAVYVVRESDIAAVEVEQGNNWRANGTGIPKFWTAEQARGLRDQTAGQWCEIEAIARAIEAEQASGPVEEKARELYEHVYVGRFEDGSSGVQAEYRKLAAHVLGQEATR